MVVEPHLIRLPSHFGAGPSRHFGCLIIIFVGRIHHKYGINLNILFTVKFG